MKKKLLIASLLFPVLILGIVVVARNNAESEIRLADEFLHAIVEPDGKNFKIFTTEKNTKSTRILQNATGKLSFFIEIPPGAYLSYSLRAESSDFHNARLTLSSDFPSTVRREYLLEQDGAHKIELRDFANRITKITFEAAVARPISWLDPTIKYPKPPPQNHETALNDFRERHKDDNVLILLLDALRANHLGCYGYKKNTTPNIDSIAKRGTLFTNAVSQAAYTLASVATLFTGFYPAKHSVLAFPNKVPADFNTIAERFQERGYQTGMFSASPNVSPAFGFHQGFQTVHRKGFRADEITPLVTQWLEDSQHDRFFGYVHFREPHQPYDPPVEFLSRFGSADINEVLKDPENWTEGNKTHLLTAYDANLAFADHQVGRILEQLERLRLRDKTVVMVVSDHGEAFWEHGVRGHNAHVYEEMIRIPFIVQIPREQRVGIREESVVGLVDILPTLGDLFRFPETAYDGESILKHWIDKEADPKRAVLSQTTGRTYARRGRDYKYVYKSGRRIDGDELYLLSGDPQEKRNLLHEYPIFSQFHRMQIERKLGTLKNSSPGSRQNAVVDENTKDELRALGYVN